MTEIKCPKCENTDIGSRTDPDEHGKDWTLHHCKDENCAYYWLEGFQ